MAANSHNSQTNTNVSATSNTCLELALEGERLCKSCDFEGGINFFEAAINIGTSDKKTLSAIYSQIGNAHFYLSNYETALHYHSLDLQLAKSMKDIIGEAKASGNLGNTLKMLGQFEEAAIYCDKHLQISRSLNDKVGEGRALYNLGNVYHTKGKHLASNSFQDPGDFPDYVKNCFLQAVDYYEKNLQLMIELGDKSAQGRALGNLGNTHYLLGNFDQAIYYHTERLRIAQEFKDKAAERRAHCNLGNAHIFLWDFEKAIYNFKQTLIIAQELRDKVLEAQAYYSLGNTYTLLRDFKTSIDYHLKHLELAQELSDQVGEGRAYWSLSNAFNSIGNHKEALNFAYKHLDVSKKIGDKIGQETATKTISELRLLLNKEGISSSTVNKSEKTPERPKNKRLSMENMNLLKLTPSKQDEDIFIPSVSTNNSVASGSRSNIASNGNIAIKSEEEDHFLDLLVKSQGKRMNDQRCSFDPLENKENCRPKSSRYKRGAVTTSTQNPISNSALPTNNQPDVNSNNGSQSRSNTLRGNNSTTSNTRSMGNSQSGSSAYSTSESTHLIANNNENPDDLFNLIENMQSRRFDEQRAPLLKRSFTINGSDYYSGSNGSTMTRQHSSERYSNHGSSNGNRNTQLPTTTSSSLPPDDDFIEQLIRCQSSRLEDQRCVLPPTLNSNNRETSLNNYTTRRSLRSNDRSRSSNVTNQTNRHPSRISSQTSNGNSRGSTLPDEDFFSLIMRFQSARIEDQRFVLPPGNNQYRHPNRNNLPSYPQSVSSRKSSVSDDERTKCSKV
ncbi:G-protein-signaling modulator 2-like [Tetranychus urticae]|uniref:G-protein-signaling modulator 2-like n=1 Tax=Tetranychus urticae TaxID=32264 RepID=UPI00077BDA2F|nr:G-protein-signaling modulator 2-like [Tetranychus urticae]